MKNIETLRAMIEYMLNGELVFGSGYLLIDSLRYILDTYKIKNSYLKKIKRVKIWLICLLSFS